MRTSEKVPHFQTAGDAMSPSKLWSLFEENTLAAASFNHLSHSNLTCQMLDQFEVESKTLHTI